MKCKHFVVICILVCALHELQHLGRVLFYESLHDQYHPLPAYKMYNQSIDATKNEKKSWKNTSNLTKESKS